MTNTVKIETSYPYVCTISYCDSDEIRATLCRPPAITYFRRAIQMKAEKVELVDMTTGEILGRYSRENGKLEIYVSPEILVEYESRG